jgi:acyl carrier protein
MLLFGRLWFVNGSTYPNGVNTRYAAAMNPTELIQNFLHDRLGTDVGSVVDSARLADLGVDSLMLAELMFEAEDRLGISISSDQTPPETVADMVALIEKLLTAKRQTA